MENPVSIVKSNITVGKVFGFFVAGVVVFALLDLAGLSQWLLFPVTTAKQKFGKPAA